MIREAIILAGGLGTRLRDTLPGLPKCMAPVNGIPFIDYVIAHLLNQGIEHFIFALGHMHTHVEDHLKEKFPDVRTTCSVEPQPLGTGGAILLACEKTTEDDVIVVNGDTLFAADIRKLSAYHVLHGSLCTLALKPMKDFDRYGVVEIDKDGHVRTFREKKQYSAGLINGGVYALNIPGFLALGLPDSCSFEKDFLEKHVGSVKMTGIPDDSYFIDIGIPEDYRKASVELPELFAKPGRHE